MYKIKVNNTLSFDIETTAKTVTVNNRQVNADIVKLNSNSYHVIDNDRSFNVEVVAFNRDEKTADIKVNGNIYTLQAKDQFDALLDQLGLSSLNSSKVSEIKAPMPGLVLKVLVNEGDEIKKGDNLFILEAMKMENIIKAPADATVKTIKVKPADKVEKGQLIIQFK